MAKGATAHQARDLRQQIPAYERFAKVPGLRVENWLES
jgi:hypothetical protein